VTDGGFRLQAGGRENYKAIHRKCALVFFKMSVLKVCPILASLVEWSLFVLALIVTDALCLSLATTRLSAQPNELKSNSNHSLKTQCLNDGGANWSQSRQMLAAARIPVPLHTLQKGQYSGVREPLHLVIRAQDQWEDVWKRHSSIEASPPPPPPVDFSAEMVAGVFLGEKSTGGYEAEIIRAEPSDSTLYLYYREKRPSQDAVAIQALTQPYHLIKVSRYDTSVIFLREGP
jgi:hypothetical protein